MKIEATLSIGFPTARRKEIFELDDNLTDEEIDEEVQQWANDYIDTGWKRVG